MRNLGPWTLFSGSLIVVAIGAAGCGSEGGSGGTGGTTTSTTDTGGTGGLGGTGGTGGLGGTGGTGGAQACPGFGNTSTTCRACQAEKCCDEIQACIADASCLDCASAATPPKTCNGQPIWEAWGGCIAAKCSAECGITQSVCNPVTNEGCDTAAGQTCDYGGDHFACFDPPNDAKLCEPCTNDAASSGPFCGPTLHCQDPELRCTRFCCTDADCATGTCDHQTLGLAGVGQCVGGVPASGWNGENQVACDAPAIAPSGGSCYTGATGG